MRLLRLVQAEWHGAMINSVVLAACRRHTGGWSFHPVYSSYVDLLGVSHGRMPCLHA